MHMTFVSFVNAFFIRLAEGGGSALVAKIGHILMGQFLQPQQLKKLAVVLLVMALGNRMLPWLFHYYCKFMRFIW